MHLHHEGSMIGVQYQLMICRGHIRASKGAFQIFLCLTVPGADPGFGQGGAPASEAESCQCSEAESRE